MKLQQFATEIRGLGERVGVDVRLEVLLAELYLGGLDPRQEIMIYPQGLFARDYRPDVGVGTGPTSVQVGPVHEFDGVAPLDNAPDAPTFLNIPVYRDGLYDYLPEGLFHQPTEIDEREYAKEIDEQYRRAQAARRFFRPIEQEFFLQGLLLELEERKYLINEENLRQNAQGAILRNIWGLPSDRLKRVPREKGTGWTTTRAPLLDVRQLNNLLHLLPVAHRLVNHQPLIERLFALVLGVPVQLRTIPPLLLLIELGPDDAPSPVALGQIEMGNFSLEGVYQDTMPALEIRLGPLNEAQLTDFLPEGRSKAVLDLLTGYFLPAETELVTHLLTDEDNQFLTLAEEGANPTSVLGWASCI